MGTGASWLWILPTRSCQPFPPALPTVAPHRDDPCMVGGHSAQDHIISFWLGLGCIGLTTALAAVGTLLTYIPWGTVIPALLRLLVYLLLGPHMYFVGLRLDAARDAERALSEEFDSASSERREAILADIEAEMLAQAKRDNEAELQAAAKWSPWAAESMPEFGLIIESQPNAREQKYLSTIERERSFAYATTEAGRFIRRVEKRRAGLTRERPHPAGGAIGPAPARLPGPAGRAGFAVGSPPATELFA